MVPERRSLNKMLVDCVDALNEIDWICRRARMHGVDMGDIDEIERLIDKAQGRDKEVRDMMNKSYRHK